MEHLSYLIARCTKCSAKTKISSAKTASIAKVVIKDKVGYTHKVTMFSDTIPLICEAISIEEQLLTSGMIQVSVDGRNTLEVIDIVGLADTAAVITISSSRKCPSATRPRGRGIEHTYSASAKPLIHSMGTLRLPHQQ